MAIRRSLLTFLEGAVRGLSGRFIGSITTLDRLETRQVDEFPQR